VIAENPLNRMQKNTWKEL